jgi:hypothetical protein
MMHPAMHPSDHNQHRCFTLWGAQGVRVIELLLLAKRSPKPSAMFETVCAAKYVHPLHPRHPRVNRPVRETAGATVCKVADIDPDH